MDKNHVFTVSDIKGCTEEEKSIIRYRMMTDLFWLNNNILRSPKSAPLLEKVHGGICDSLIQKYPTPSTLDLIPNFNPPIIKNLEEWSSVKERVILSSRGTLKSTIEAGDLVQLVLCEPNIRILILSGKLGLAKTILRMARGFFEVNEVLGYLFPQWCAILQTNAEEFTSPARHGVNYRDPTIQIGTFGSVKAGVHAEYIGLDDCTNEVNQATPELVQKSIESYDDLDPLLEPGGYTTFTGTRWAVDDLPEYIRSKGHKMEEETGRKHVIYFFQPIWKIKQIDDSNLLPSQAAKLQEERDERAKKHQLVPDDVELLWPEKLTAEYLWPKYRKNPRKFACQYLLNPEGVTSGVFTRGLLLRQTRKIEDCPLPHRSIVVINWDLAGISGKGDFAAGIVGIWEDTGRLYIIDAIIDRFRSSTDICNAIVRLYKKWQPDYHRIESSNGSELLSGELRIIAQKAGLDQAFHAGWDPPTHEDNAKYTRVMILPGALERNQIQFFAGIPCLEELFKQLEQFGQGTKGRAVSTRAKKDDGPDCLAQLYEKWKDSIGPKSIQYLTPSDVVVDFQSELPKKEEIVDPHLEEYSNADIDFLKSMTAPTSGI